MRTHIVNGQEVSGGAIDVLYKLFFYGPQDDSDLPSKVGMADLIELGWAVKDYDVPLPNKLTYTGLATAQEYYRDERWKMQQELFQAKQFLSASITSLSIKSGDLVLCRTSTAPAPEEVSRLVDAVRRLSGVTGTRFIVMRDTYELTVASDEVLSSMGLMRKPEMTDLEIVQKAMNVRGHYKVSIYNDGSWAVGVKGSSGDDFESLLTWAKQTIGVE